MMKNNLLYIGNKLLVHGNTATTIETLGPLLESEGFRVRYASSKKSKAFRMLHMIGVTFRYAKSSDYVLIDTYSTTNFWYAFVVSQICRFLNVKYIPILHGGQLPDRLAGNPKLCKMLFGNAHLNVAPSGYLMDAFQKFGLRNLMFIANSIEVCDYDFKRRSSVEPKLLWVRSFVPLYNPEMAIDALQGLKTEFPNASLCLVGPDKRGYMKEVVAYAAKSNADVRFTGRLTKPEWRELSKEYDIFINTTHFDNTPVSVMEGMALGLPVVSTSVGGIPFLLEHRNTAMLVPDSDTQAMISAIKELVANPELASSLSQNGRNLVDGFDWTKVRFKWLEILK